MKTLHFKITAVLILAVFFLQAQSKKKILPEEYTKWSELKDEKMAPDGKWIAFVVDYTVGTDTLFLQHVATGKRRKFPKGNQAVFTPDSNWFLYSIDNALAVHNLKDKTTIRVQNVKKHAFNKANGILAILTANDSKLLLYKTKEKKPQEIPNTKDFAFSSSGALAFLTYKGVTLIQDTKSPAITILEDTESSFSGLTWDDSGSSLVFFKTASNGTTTAVSYHSTTGKMQFLEKEAIAQMKVELQSSKPVLFDPVAQRIFLYAKSTQKPALTDDTLVEVWEAATPLHYPAQKETERIPYVPKLHIWDLKDNSLKKMVSDTVPKIRLLPNRKYALAYNPNKAGNLHLENPVADYYLLDLQTGSTKLLLPSQCTAAGLLAPSPKDSYIGYFDDSGWNIYNYKTAVHRLIFDKASVEKEEEDEKYKSTSPGWTQDGKYMILYIGLDIWLISPDGTQKKRITNGKETGIKFRPANEIHKSDRPFLNEEIGTKYFNLSEGLILQASLPNKTTSIYKWTPAKGLILLYKDKAKVSVCCKSANGQSILIERQTATVPPSLWLIDSSTKKAVLQYQSNSHYKKYEMPRVKLLSYKNGNGKNLNAVLHYPTGYEEGKKYPMIVYIYELLSQHLYSYNSPSLWQTTGFAPANYTNDGYFVLLPDITYTIRDPGTSAADCVLKAVDVALQTATIDNKRIGLIGHSYGGHETSLILTKTPIFAAAVAGAASTNMISDYLSLNDITLGNKFWKFESHQYRMGISPFDNWEAYIKNSPVMNAEKITTPLLSWTGKADGTVDWRQSVELHLALKRLKKKNTLLVYPNEGHILNNLEAQFDLTSRIKKWFDTYLK
jgi:dipeptidyl aminopeptidase/acylaminoacyl peptidase